MAKVEMSLQEYNELMNRLKNAEEMLEALVTPSIDTWHVQWFKDHPESTMDIRSNPDDNMNKTQREMFKEMVCKKLHDFFVEIGVSPETVDYELETPTMHITYLRHFNQEHANC